MRQPRPELADIVAKVENRTAVKISRKLISRPLRCCIGFQCHYGDPRSILDQSIWSLTSSRAKRISGSKNFRSTSQKDFCNNIGPFRTFWDVRFESAKRRVADMSQAALASLDFMSTHPSSPSPVCARDHGLEALFWLAMLRLIGREFQSSQPNRDRRRPMTFRRSATSA